MTTKLSPTLFELYLHPLARVIDGFAARGAEPGQVEAARRSHAALLAALELLAAGSTDEPSPQAQFPRFVPDRFREPR